MIMPINNNNNLAMQQNMQQLSPYQERYLNMNLNQQQQQNTNVNFLIVENMQKAKEQIVPYGYTMYMRDSSEPYQYIKSVDNVGTPTFRVLKFEDVTDKMNSLNGNANSGNNYVSSELFNNLVLKVQNLENYIQQYHDEFNNNKPKVGRPTKEKVGDINE